MLIYCHEEQPAGTAEHDVNNADSKRIPSDSSDNGCSICRCMVCEPEEYLCSLTAVKEGTGYPDKHL